MSIEMEIFTAAYASSLTVSELQTTASTVFPLWTGVKTLGWSLARHGIAGGIWA